MNFAAADEVAKAVLYEGYVLYPYRPSAIKNRQRWTFGGVYPAACPTAGASRMESQCLVEGNGDTGIEVRVRFLHPLARQVGELTAPLEMLPPDDVEPTFRPVASLALAGRSYYTWEEVVEREVRLPLATLGEIATNREPLHFAFAASRTMEPLLGADGLVHGLILRTQAAIEGIVTLTARAATAGAHCLCVSIENTTSAPRLARSAPDVAQLRGFMSTHMILGVEGGAFVSLVDPAEHLADAARACVNQSAWPVLVGDEGARDTLLCSPIILYDYPQIAPESPGDLFDGTEIDEILTLRILAMTDAEKHEMAANDERARALLARTEALTQEQMQLMHGVMRSPPPSPRVFGGAPSPRLATLNDGALSLRVGDHVRLNPKSGGDIIDLALAGQAAVVEAIEVDFDNRVHVAVTVDADPGRDFGLERMPGHRFFFSPEEIERISPAGSRP